MTSRPARRGSPPRRGLRSSAGFTLLEVLIAVMVLAIGIMASAKLGFQLGGALHDSKSMTEACSLAEGWLAGLDTTGVDDLDFEEAGDFGEDHPGFTWRTELEETDVPKVRRITLTVLWDNEGKRLDFERLIYVAGAAE